MANPEITAIRAMLAASPSNMTIDELRQMYDGLGGQFPTASDVTVTPVTVNGVPAEWTVSPAASDDKVVLYLHGGGYVIGSILSHRHLASEIGRAAGTKSLAIDYRLAPEHPFPAAVEDALAAYRHLLDAGYKPGSIAIAGDSAGGGLTVATLLAAKAAGLPQPSCGFCISPWVDMEALGGSMDFIKVDGANFRDDGYSELEFRLGVGAQSTSVGLVRGHGELQGVILHEAPKEQGGEGHSFLYEPGSSVKTDQAGIKKKNTHTAFKFARPFKV